MKDSAWGFDRLFGQEKNIEVIKKLIAKGTLSHALLLTGPPGSGKSSLALLIAQALNCAQSAEGPCEICVSCRKIRDGNHADVIVVEPEERSIKIDPLREVKKRFIYYPQEQGIRVCLIEDAHCLTSAAAAALLKIMEEPPERLVFLLTTSYPSGLPSTILSRCQHYLMQRLDNMEMEEYLREFSPGATESEITLAKNLSEGLPGRAQDIVLNQVWGERREMVYNVGEKLISPDISEKELLGEAKKWVDREDLTQLLELLANFFKDGMVWKLSEDSFQLFDKDLHEFWREYKIGAMKLKSCLELVNDTRKMLLTNINRLLGVENLFLQIRGRIFDV